jgi:type II secretion system protein N
MWKKAALVISFMCYALVLTVILLVVRFPKQTFVSYAVDTIEAKLPGFSCAIGDITYQYPLSLQFERVSIENPEELLDINIANILFTLDQKSIGNRGSLRFDLYGGIVEMDVILHRETGVIEIPSLVVSGIRLVEVEPLQRRLGRKIGGLLDYSGKFKGKRGELSNGLFSGNIRLNDFQLTLKKPILQNDIVAFDSVTASGVLQNGRLVISDGVATGPSYNGQFDGQVHVAGQWQESTLSIKGKLQPQDTYVKQNRQVARAVSLLYKKYGTSAIPYNISGKFREPLFQFGESGQTIN